MKTWAVKCSGLIFGPPYKVTKHYCSKNASNNHHHVTKDNNV